MEWLTLACDMKGGCSTSMPSVLTTGARLSNWPRMLYFPGPGIAYEEKARDIVVWNITP